LQNSVFLAILTLTKWSFSANHSEDFSRKEFEKP
jgi:hypothetical protein